MARTNTHGDLFGKIGAVVFLVLGIAALVFVFVTALHLFQSPVPGLGLPVSKGQTPPTGLNIGAALAALFSKLAILALMIVAGSLMASYGIRLYQAASLAHHPHVSDLPVTDTTSHSESAKPSS